MLAWCISSVLGLSQILVIPVTQRSKLTDTLAPAPGAPAATAPVTPAGEAPLPAAAAAAAEAAQFSWA